MNENAQKWVEALRSGEYRQGHGKLSAYGEHCCLGVACVLYQEEVGDLEIVTPDDFGRTAYDGHTDILPSKVQKWLGLATAGSAFRKTEEVADIVKEYDGGGSYETQLSALNDGDAPFTVIADVIEKEPKGLFAS